MKELALQMGFDEAEANKVIRQNPGKISKVVL